LVAKLFVAERFPTLLRVQQGLVGGVAVAVAHGKADAVIPFQHGLAIAAAAGIANQPSEFLAVEGMGKSIDLREGWFY
jgi:hypothetical protein